MHTDDGRRDKERERELARRAALRAEEERLGIREGPPTAQPRVPRPDAQTGDKRESERERTRREFLEGLAEEARPGEAGPLPDVADGGLVGRVRGLTDEAILRAVIGAAAARIEELGMKNVVEVRPHGSGRLQLEYRIGAGGTKRGPYWSYKWFEEGRSRSLYLGKTDEPEAVLEDKLARRRG